jgi:hypothetical protein
MLDLEKRPNASGYAVKRRTVSPMFKMKSWLQGFHTRRLSME